MKQILFSPTLRKRKPKITSQESLVNHHLLEQELSKLWGEAQDLCAQNKLDEAYTKLKPYCHDINNAKYTPYLNLTGLLALQLGKFDDGLSWLLRSKNLDDNQAEVHYNLSVIYQKNKDIKKALLCLTKCLEIDKNHKDALFNRANIYESIEMYTEALIDIQNLYKLERNIDVFNLFGCIQLGLRKYESAISLFSSALSLDQNNIEIMNNLAISFKKMGDHKKVIEILSKAKSINSNFELTFNNFGVLFEEQNKLKLALENYKKSYKINKTFSNAYNLGLI